MVKSKLTGILESCPGGGYRIPQAVRDEYRNLPVAEAVILLACGRYVRTDRLQRIERRRNRRGGLPDATLRRLDAPGDTVLKMIVDGVRANGIFVQPGHADHGKRVPLDIDFLKAGAAVEMGTTGNVIPDLLDAKHFEAANGEWKYYRRVELDRSAFFEALLPVDDQNSPEMRELPEPAIFVPAHTPTSDTEECEPDRTSPPSRASVEKWYKVRHDKWPKDEKPPSRDDDIQDHKNGFDKRRLPGICCDRCAPHMLRNGKNPAGLPPILTGGLNLSLINLAARLPI